MPPAFTRGVHQCAHWCGGSILNVIFLLLLYQLPYRHHKNFYRCRCCRNGVLLDHIFQGYLFCFRRISGHFLHNVHHHPAQLSTWLESSRNLHKVVHAFLPLKSNGVILQKTVPQFSFPRGHIFSQLTSILFILRIVLHILPPASLSIGHPPHKCGGQDIVR